ncbi:MAG: helix-turn-helix domain-containing protein [Candidatus Micrarchaeota archaeon]
MPDKTQPLIVELEQIHDCTSIAVTDKLKDVKVKWLATIGQDEKTITNLFEIDTSHLRSVVDLWKNQHKVKEVSIIIIGTHKSQISVRQSKDLATAPALAKTKTMWIEPTWTEAGVDHVTMLAPNFKSLKNFMDLVKEQGYDLKIKSKRYLEQSQSVSLDSFRTSGFSKLKFASELLTDRQMEAFDIACRYGYYEEPKKISIEEMSAKLGIGPSTCSELLRKAEKKLLPVLNDILRIMR